MIIPLTVGVLTAGAIYLMLQRGMVRIIFGLSLLAHAANLLILSAGVTAWRGEPFPEVAGAADAGDPLPQAFVLTAIVALIYLATSRDRAVGPPRLPLRLVALGVLIAVGTGIWGLLGHASFLEPLHTYVLDIYLTTAMVFDLGVYLAVLGLVMEAFNLLGATGGREGTRERADESVEGEISGPMDTSRGERYAETRLGIPGRRSTYLQQDVPPRRGGDAP